MTGIQRFFVLVTFATTACGSSAGITTASSGTTSGGTSGATAGAASSGTGRATTTTTTATTTGGTPGGTSSGAAGSTSGAATSTSGSTGGNTLTSILASGTFTAMGAHVANTTINLTNVQFDLGGSNNIASFLGVADSTDFPADLSFTAPPNATNGHTNLEVIFSGPPSVETISSNQSCGEVTMTWADSANGGNFSASNQGQDCPQITNANGGSWSLSFTAVTTDPMHAGFYFAHGALTATLIDAKSDTGTLNLTF